MRSQWVAIALVSVTVYVFIIGLQPSRDKSDARGNAVPQPHVIPTRAVIVPLKELRNRVYARATGGSLAYNATPLSLRSWPRPEHLEMSAAILADSFCRKKADARKEMCDAARRGGRVALATTASTGVDYDLTTTSGTVSTELCSAVSFDRFCSQRPQDLAARIERASVAEVSTALTVCRSTARQGPCAFSSQQHEDAVVFTTWFDSTTGGVFLELGAFVDGDNTQFFERAMGWSGILIEASPTNFRELQKRRGGPGSRAKLVNSAVCSTEKVLRFLDHGAVSGLVDKLSASHVSSYDFSKTPTVSVPCRRLENILRDAGVGIVDLWVLDVEGAELDVLQSHDFVQNPIHVLVIERNINDLTIEELLITTHSFIYWREQRGNRIFVNSTFHAAKRKLRSS